MALRVSLQQLLKAQAEQGASDLHITVNSPPQMRIHGDLCPVKVDPLEPEDTENLCYSIMTEEQKRIFEENKEIDLSFNLKGIARFRANIFRQQLSVAGVFRLIPTEIKPFDALGLPVALKALCDLPRGLILVTGATGSGKSTTLAAMVDKINRELPGHILTLEDPVEFVHSHKKCIVNQRELGSDTRTLGAALKSALRQDPDVILVGELRDLDSVAAALTMAETGHLVLATLHTNSAISSITRLLDVFPAHQQSQVRTQLSSVLQGVLTQQLLPTVNNSRVIAVELLIPTPAIRAQIREDKLHLVYQSMQMSMEKTGMVTLTSSLFQLLARKAVSLDTAIGAANEPEELKGLLTRAGIARFQT